MCVSDIATNMHSIYKLLDLISEQFEKKIWKAVANDDTKLAV